MNKQDKEIIEQTKKWIEKFIISYQICPFAKYPYEAGLIRYRVDDADSYEAFLFALTNFLRDLSFAEDDFSNAFLILPFATFEFVEFYNLVEESSHLLASMYLEETFQLVAFHPQFQYLDTLPEDPANLTNRSPYPMVHILQVREISEVIQKHKDTMTIPERNKKLLSNMKKSEISKIKGLLKENVKNSD